MTRSIRLNCDMGESYGAWRMGCDEAVMPLIDQANLACGFHAGDPLTMQRSVALAARHGVAIGAHPAYPDLVGFGRRSMACAPDELEALLIYQLGALEAFCREQQLDLSYVKPHGALYNDLLRDPACRQAVLRACARYRPGLPLMVLAGAGESLRAEAERQEVPLLFEGFADRAYRPDGSLVPRAEPGAVHASAERIVAQGLAIVQGQAFEAEDGTALQLQVDSLCVHGDTPDALAVLRQLRQAMEALSCR